MQTMPETPFCALFSFRLSPLFLTVSELVYVLCLFDFLSPSPDNDSGRDVVREKSSCWVEKVCNCFFFFFYNIVRAVVLSHSIVGWPMTACILSFTPGS